MSLDSDCSSKGLTLRTPNTKTLKQQTPKNKTLKQQTSMQIKSLPSMMIIYNFWIDKYGSNMISQSLESHIQLQTTIPQI